MSTLDSEGRKGELARLNNEVLHYQTAEEAGDVEQRARKASIKVLTERGIGTAFAASEERVAMFRFRYWELRAREERSNEELAGVYRKNAETLADNAAIWGRMADGEEMDEDERAFVNTRAVNYLRLLGNRVDQSDG